MNSPLTVGLTTPNDEIFSAGGIIGSVGLSDEDVVRSILEGGITKLLDAVRVNWWPDFRRELGASKEAVLYLQCNGERTKPRDLRSH